MTGNMVLLTAVEYQHNTSSAKRLFPPYSPLKEVEYTVKLYLLMLLVINVVGSSRRKSSSSSSSIYTFGEFVANTWNLLNVFKHNCI